MQLQDCQMKITSLGSRTYHQTPEPASPLPLPDTYLILCVGGLEKDTVAAAIAYFNIRRDKHYQAEAACTWTSDFEIFEIDEEARVGNAGCGKVILETNIPPQVVLSIPFVIEVLAYIGEDHALPPERDIALVYLHDILRDAVKWEAAMRLWACVRDSAASTTAATDSTSLNQRPSWTDMVVTKIQPFSCKFRASVVRDGVHPCGGMDMLPALGDGASARLGEDFLTVDLLNFDLEIVAIVLHQHVHFGLVLDGARSTFKSGMPSERVPPILFKDQVTASLRPSTAHLFLAMCNPCVGDVVCDFMAGVGTVPLVAAIAPPPSPQTFSLGGDQSDEAWINMQQNFDFLREKMHGCVDNRCTQGKGRSAVVGLARWDSRRLPLRDGIVDVGIVDLPFGKRHKHKGGPMLHLYERAFREMARVIRPGGRLLVLAARASFVEDAFNSVFCVGCWSPSDASGTAVGHDEELRPRRVNIGGMRAVVYLVFRTVACMPVLPDRYLKKIRTRKSHQRAKKEVACDP